MRTRVHRLGTRMVIAALLTMVMTMGSVPTAYAGNGSISGTVSGPSGALAGIDVDVYDLDYAGSWITDAVTDADGHYTLAGLRAGRYTVKFDANAYNRTHGTDLLGEKYPLPVTVVADSETTGIDAVLEEPGIVTGIVTCPASPLGDVLVEFRHTDTGASAGIAHADSQTGRYTWILPPGTYTVEFRVEIAPDVWRSIYYDGASDAGSATPITITSNVTTPNINATVDFTADMPGITGTVTGTDGPLRSVRVSAYRSPTSSAYMATCTTDAEGHYALLGLADGTYYIGFDPTYYNNYVVRGAGLLEEYYNDSRRLLESHGVAVVSGGKTTGIDAQLQKAGSISGYITERTGPAEYVYIYAYYAATGDEVKHTQCSSLAGTYTLPDLWPGDYIIEFRKQVLPVPAPRQSLYFDDTMDRNAATLVTVVGGADTPHIDAHVDFRGSISGTVTCAGSTPPDGVTVKVYRTAGGVPVATVSPTTGGAFTIPDLPTGEYLLEFDAEGTDYISEYYSDSTEPADAARVAVGRNGTVTSGIDADLAEGGVVTGTVVGPLGPLKGVSVSACDPSTGVAVATTVTDAAGGYRLAALSAGDHVIKFDPAPFNTVNGSDFVMEYHNDVTTLAGATRLPITLGSETSGINAELACTTGWIGGTVSRAGVPSSDIDVWVWDAAMTTEVGYATTDSNGHYAVYGLPAGTYITEFDPTPYNQLHGTDYIREYYAEVMQAGSAAPVTVTLGSGRSGIDGNLDHLGGSIAGSVTGTYGTTKIPLPDILVYAWDAVTHAFASYAVTDDTGRYVIHGLPSGRYIVGFDPSDCNDGAGTDYYAEYYSNAADPADAQSVAVTAGATTTSINGLLDTPDTSYEPVYRFYNFTNGTHFFTPSEDEALMIIDTWPDIFDFEGVAYYTNPVNNTQPLYRFYNRRSKSHFYTADPAEAQTILARWPDIFSLDGQTYAVNPGPVTDSVPVYRFYNLANGSHFYTSTVAERDQVMATLAAIYHYEGVAFWLGQ